MFYLWAPAEVRRGARPRRGAPPVPGLRRERGGELRGQEHSPPATRSRRGRPPGGARQGRAGPALLRDSLAALKARRSTRPGTFARREGAHLVERLHHSRAGGSRACAGTARLYARGGTRAPHRSCSRPCGEATACCASSRPAAPTSTASWRTTAHSATPACRSTKPLWMPRWLTEAVAGSRRGGHHPLLVPRRTGSSMTPPWTERRWWCAPATSWTTPRRRGTRSRWSCSSGWRQSPGRPSTARSPRPSSRANAERWSAIPRRWAGFSPRGSGTSIPRVESHAGGIPAVAFGYAGRGSPAPPPEPGHRQAATRKTPRSPRCPPWKADWIAPDMPSSASGRPARRRCPTPQALDAALARAQSDSPPG